MNKIVFVLTASAIAAAAQAQVRFTEWMYQGVGEAHEYIEITNTGASPVSLDTYSFDDSSRVAGSFQLSGILAPGASAIITDITPGEFQALWNTPAGLMIFGSNGQNLGRGDELNLFNGFDLVDRLTYGDNVAGVGGPRTQNFSGITQPANWGTNIAANWFRAAVGDAYGSYANTLGDVGNPGFVPAPGAAAVLGLGLIAGGRRRR